MPLERERDEEEARKETERATKRENEDREAAIERQNITQHLQLTNEAHNCEMDKIKAQAEAAENVRTTKTKRWKEEFKKQQAFLAEQSGSLQSLHASSLEKPSRQR